jgi:hypothetical protein
MISYILTVVFLGIAFQTILFGLTIGLSGLILICDPVYRFFIRLLKLENIPPHLLSPPIWSCIAAVFPICTSLIIIGFSIWILIREGFCFQNFFCLFFLIKQG